MCGIFAYIGSESSDESMRKSAELIRHRGPDETREEKIADNILFIFHRLSINGLNYISGQPMHYGNCVLICNGEIYNYKSLIEIYGFGGEYMSGSDCEIILHLYLHFRYMTGVINEAVAKMLQELDGVFAFVLYDSANNIAIIGRDPIGIRSLYIGRNSCSNSNGGDYSGEVAFASEMKALKDFSEVAHFKPAHYMLYNCVKSSEKVMTYESYYKHEYVYNYKIRKCEDTTIQQEEMQKHTLNDVIETNVRNEMIEEAEICAELRRLFIEAVRKRLMCDRDVCCLLSGGLDSSLTTAIVAKLLKETHPEKQLHTYAIGFKDSTDLKYARIVADYVGTIHHEKIVSEEEFLGLIPETIYQIESYCTTSVRASVGNYLVSLFIRDDNKTRQNDSGGGNSGDNVVVYCGDMSDEIFASYRGFQYANKDQSAQFFEENVKLVRDVYLFDVLRSDKSISGAGLESREPFADKDLIRFVMSLHPKWKMFDDNKIEKYILRKAFADDGILPDSVLWRRKEAFSDGVSSHERSWFHIIREYVAKLGIKPNTYNDGGLQPYDAESEYYRQIFNGYYPNRAAIVPYYWRHPFSTNMDPSARLLDNYKKELQT